MKTVAGMKVPAFLRRAPVVPAFLFAALSAIQSPASAGDFTMNLGTNPNWPANGTGPVNFTMTDQYGFQVDATANITRFGGSAVSGYPNEVNFFGTQTSLGLVYDAGSGNSGVGESTNTATLSFFSGGVAYPMDAVSFIVSDIDPSDNNAASDRCDFVTATGDNGNPTLSYVDPVAANRTFRIGVQPGSGATGTLAANEAQCIYNTGATPSANSAGDDFGSMLVTYPAGTSVATIAYDESIENVYGVTSRNAAARGIGIWAASAFTVNQSISLAKSTPTTSYSAAGEIITYTYVITNNGGLPINTGQNIYISDDKFGAAFPCNNAITAPIPVGGTHSCTANYTTTAADAAAPNVTNNAIAGVGTGSQSFASRLQSNTAQAVVPRAIPSMSLSKSAGTPTTAGGAVPTLTDGGDTITYSYTVNNTGNVALTGVSITDPGPSFDGNAGTGSLSAFSPASATIPVGGSQVFTATYTLSQNDVNNAAGVTNGVSNTATANGTGGGIPVASNNSTANTTIPSSPSFTIVKNVDVASITSPGTLTYTITVDNTGNIDLTGTSLTDVLDQNGTTLALTSGPTLSGDSNGNSILETTETWTYIATYNVTQADIDDGNDLVNTATFDTDQTPSQSDTATTTITTNPSMSIVKTATLVKAGGNTGTDAEVGDTINYQYDVTNNGNITMTDVEISDVHSGSDPLADPSNETLINDAGASIGDSTDATANNTIWSTLAPGDTIRFTTSYVVTQTDFDNQ